MNIFKNLIILTLISSFNVQADIIKDVGFVDITSVAPDVIVAARYNTEWNFTGRRVPGYFANRCYLTHKAALALSEVQKEVASQGFTLLVFDCYRPKRAVAEFVAWAARENDSAMKSVFYPEEEKSELVKRGYISSRSGHSRGSVIDLTLVKSGANKSRAETLRFKEPGRDCRNSEKISTTGQLDMGTTYDCFSELSYTASEKVSPEAHKNRMTLKSAMEKHGFENYSKEWWHFGLKDEPYPDQYFDFAVK